MNFWDRIKSIFHEKKQEQPQNQIEREEQDIARMRMLFEIKKVKSFIELLEHLMFVFWEKAMSKSGNEQSIFIGKAEGINELLNLIESITEEKIKIAENNLELRKRRG